jgi:hypothetical protein
MQYAIPRVIADHGIQTGKQDRCVFLRNVCPPCYLQCYRVEPDGGVPVAAGWPWSLNCEIVVVLGPPESTVSAQKATMSPFFMAAGAPPKADFDTE